MPVKAKAEVDEVFAKLADYKGQINAKSAKVDELTKALAAKDAEIAALSAKVKEFEGQKKGEAEALFVTTEARIVEFTGKLEALLKEVEEVKKTGVVVAGVAGVTAAAGAAAPAAAEAAGAPAETAAGTDFGFAGGSQDPFADSNW
jgi:peptidoglycan hydrolase CwlO-like protein